MAGSFLLRPFTFYLVLYWASRVQVTKHFSGITIEAVRRNTVLKALRSLAVVETRSPVTKIELPAYLLIITP